MVVSALVVCAQKPKKRAEEITQRAKAAEARRRASVQGQWEKDVSATARKKSAADQQKDAKTQYKKKEVAAKKRRLKDKARSQKKKRKEL